MVRKPVAARGLMNGLDCERSELGTKNRRFEGFPHQYFLQQNENPPSFTKEILSA